MRKSACFAIMILMICISALMSGCAKPLACPGELTVDDDNRLTWTSVADARSYVIEIKNVDTDEIEPPITLRKTNYSLSTLKEGDYEIKVRAVVDELSGKGSDWSSVLFFHRNYENGCIYTLINNNKEYEITKAGTASGSIRIEDNYRGKPVTAIGAGAFKGSGKIENVIIGNNVRLIGASAFYNCSKLVSVTIPDSVTEIGISAFQGCRLLRSITIPGNVTTINEYTFSYCRSLEDVIFGSKVTTIKESAFSDCSVLTGIIIPDTVTSIDNYAFSQNTSMTSVTFGSDLTTLGSYAFSHCSMLESVNFSQDNHLSYIGEGAFSDCSALSEILLPEGLTSIGDYAFYNSKKLNTVNIPDSVSRVGAYAFNETKLFNDTIIEKHEDLVYVDRWLVYCTDPLRLVLISISGIFLKNGVVGIADYVFYSAENLESVTFPTSLRYIGTGAFGYNKKLWQIIIPENSVQVIGGGAFAGCSLLINISLGEGLITIGDYAFYDCSKLNNSRAAGASIIPQSVTSIGVRAFDKTALWNDAVDGIVYAGNWVVGCDAVNSSVTLKAGTMGIADYTFYKSMDIKNISGVGIANVRYIGRGAFYKSTLVSITLGDNLRTIEDYTFYGCIYLENIIMPGNLTSIGRSAFYKCNSLNEIDLSGSMIKTIGMYAFYGCDNVKEVNFGEYLTDIGYCAFYRCISLESLTIPDTVKTIGDRAFYNCELLNELTIGSGVTEIGEYVFSDCTALENIEIPSSVKAIGKYAFYNCTAITRLILKNGVETIGDYAFSGLENITSLVLPESVVNVGRYAFKDCNGLSSIFINSGIAQIGAHAFYGCKEMTIYTDAESIPSGWDSRFNSSYRPIVFGCVLSENHSHIVSIFVKDESILNPNAINGIAAPGRDGHIFMGWAAEPNSTVVKFAANNISSVAAGTILYAVWIEADPETID